LNLQLLAQSSSDQMANESSIDVLETLHGLIINLLKSNIAGTNQSTIMNLSETYKKTVESAAKPQGTDLQSFRDDSKSWRSVAQTTPSSISSSLGTRRLASNKSQIWLRIATNRETLFLRNQSTQIKIDATDNSHQILFINKFTSKTMIDIPQESGKLTLRVDDKESEIGFKTYNKSEEMLFFSKCDEVTEFPILIIKVKDSPTYGRLIQREDIFKIWVTSKKYVLFRIIMDNDSYRLAVAEEDEESFLLEEIPTERDVMDKTGQNYKVSFQICFDFDTLNLTV
jgi:hypothetical protein